MTLEYITFEYNGATAQLATIWIDPVRRTVDLSIMGNPKAVTVPIEDLPEEAQAFVRKHAPSSLEKLHAAIQQISSGIEVIKDVYPEQNMIHSEAYEIFNLALTIRNKFIKKLQDENDQQ